MDKGSINFASPEAGGVSSGAVIQDGRYTIPVENGLPPGKYLVRIYASAKQPATEVPKVPGPAGPAGHPGQRIAAAYNEESTLFVEVPKGESACSFDFDVKSK